jgi:tRNA-2-methylthio-N6-dimethylallyladenosine synthase
MREVTFDAAFAFKFSPRAGTPAADLSDQVSDSLRASRLSSVLSLQDDLSLQRNTAWIGRRVEVLVDRELSKRDSGLAAGRTRQNKIVHFSGGEVLEGELASVEITAATPHHLKGLLTPSS